jgi:hypothetical protein
VKKVVVALNKSYDLARLTSGLGHVTLGLAASLGTGVGDLDFKTYASKDGAAFPWISNWSFVVLRGRGGQLRTLRQGLLDAGLPCVAYLDTMLEGGTDAEMAATAARTQDELDLLAVATFGEVDALQPLTGKLSVWR